MSQNGQTHFGTLCIKELTLTHIFCKLFYEILQSKGACSNNPIYSSLLFHDIYVVNSLCVSLSLRCH